MIELPEAAVLARQVNSALAGKRIKNVVANYSPHKFAWYSGDPARYPDLLAGKTIHHADSYAGEVEIHVDGMILLIGAGIRYHPVGDPLPSKHQLLLEFEDATMLTAGIQMWGCLLCFREGETVRYESYSSARTEPSPLSDSFDRPYFDRLFNENSGKLSAKAFLATEQRIPGLGNGVLQDILWTARIHPKRKMAGLTDDEIGNMYLSVKTVLGDMARQGGRDTERDLFGCPGGYLTILSKNTAGKPCPVCGTPIKKEPYLGGSIYTCERCQAL